MSASSLERVLEALGRLKEFAGLRPDGYSFPAVTDKVRPNSLASHEHSSSIRSKLRDAAKANNVPLSVPVGSNAKDYGSSQSRLWNGGLIRLPSVERIQAKPALYRGYEGLRTGVLRAGQQGGHQVPDGVDQIRRGLRRHEIVHSLLQQRRGGPPDTVAKLAGEEFTAYRKQLFGKKSPVKGLPLGTRLRKIIDGTIESTKRGKKTLGITKWFEVSQAALSAARNRTEKNPTPSQIEVGNYRKGSLSFHGLPVRIENPKGSTRCGVDDDGKPWESEMLADYGYFATTKAADGDAVDCFLGPDLKSHFVLAVDQYKGNEFDETKFILGTPNCEAGKELYLRHYPAGWKLGPTASTTTSQLKEWLQSGDTKKPFVGQRLKALNGAYPMKQFSFKNSTLWKAHDLARRHSKMTDQLIARGTPSHQIASIHSEHFNPDTAYSITPKLRAEAAKHLHVYRKTKEFAGLIPDGYIRPGVVPENRDNKIATYRSPSSLNDDVKDYRENFGGSLKEHYQSLAKTAGTKPKNVARGGIITLAPTSRLASLPGDLGESVRQYGEPALARHALRRHEIVHSILQQRRKGPPDTVAKLAGEEFTAYRKQLFGKKSPARHLPLGTRVRKIIDGTIDSTKRGKKTLGIKKWFEDSRELTAREKGMKEFEKPFLRYNSKRHARTGGLNDSFREKYNREHGSDLKRPVTKKPSELKPGSKAAKRRESFCARMSGVQGPTSKDGKLTPKGAALKRWNCSALLQKVKEFSQTPEEERHELLKTGILSAGLAGGLALAGRGLRGTVGAAERASIQRSTANKIVSARRNARAAGEARAAESAKAAKVAARARYKAGNASFQNLSKDPNLTKGEKAAVKRTHSIWKAVNPGKEFSSVARERSGSEKLRDGAIGAGALAAGGGILHAGLKVGKAADEVSPTARAIRSVLAHGEQAAGNFRKGWIGRVLRLSAKNPTMKRFALKTDEDGVPLTGKTAHDRFVKTIREGDLDRRDRNINNAAGAGAAAGWLTHRKGATLNQRLGRLGLGAAAGMGGVLAVRAATDKHRDIYGDRPRWAKRAEALPTIAGVGAAGAILAKKAKLFASRPSENPGHQVIKAGLSGAASGALLGGGTALLTRGKSLKSALQAAGIGASAMGALAGGGTAIGNKVLGNADANDKAAFTKRAAVGGALAGAALGGAGAVALKKGLLGSRVSSAFAKGAKTWRPLHAIQTSSAPAAAAIGAGAGSLYGAHQGADEGMMVDAINNSKLASFGQNPNKKNLSAKIRGLIKEFGYSSQLREKDSQRYVSAPRAALGLHGDVVDASGQAASLAGIQTARGFYNKAKGVHRWGGRGTGLLRDAGDVMAGKPRRTDQAGRPQKREWEKAWFHRTAGTAATAAAMLGGAALATKTKFGQQHIMPQIKKVDATTRKHGVSLFSAKLRRTLKQFDLDAALAGWDVRDPRGKSARVFAPGSRPRFRRQKEWHEKKENREALLKGAIVGTGLIGAAGGIAASRKIAGLPMIPKIAKVVKHPYPVARPGEKPSKFANFVPIAHRGGNIEEFPIKFRPTGAA